MPRASQPSWPRIEAPLVQRPTSWFAQGLSRRVQPMSSKGVRTWSDDAIYPGRLLEVDVLLGDRSLVSTVMEVEWCEEQPGGSPAQYEIGLRFVKATRMDLERIEPVLGGK